MNRIVKKLPPVGPALAAYRTAFQPLALGDLECLELLCPEVQALPQYRDYFENLTHMGRPLLEIYLNDNLGAQSVKISPNLLAQFTKQRNIDSLILKRPGPAAVVPAAAGPQLVLNTLAAVYLVSPFAAQQIAKNLISGFNGLANLYIYSW